MVAACEQATANDITVFTNTGTTQSVQTAIDPTEYVYEITGTGTLMMGDGSVRHLTLVFSNSNWPDFHVPSSFESGLWLYAYFDNGSLCFDIELIYDGNAWGAKNRCCYVANGPYPDGWVSSWPYWMHAENLSIMTDPSDKKIIQGLVFSSNEVTAVDPHKSGYAGAIKSLSVNLSFSHPLGYGAADYKSAVSVDALRFMDTRSRLASVPAVIDAGLKKDPVTYAPQLTHYLTQGLTNPLEKVRVIHDWIAANIYYDYYWYETYYVPNPVGEDNDKFIATSPCAVLKEGKTACGGFSLLMWYLCRLENIHVQVMRGLQRGVSNPTTQSDHTWNIISVNGTIYHIDTNADSGNQYTIQKKWVPGAYRAEWFLPPPELFCAWRWPYKVAHRYPGQPATGDAFYATPLPMHLSVAGSYVTKEFYDHGFSLSSGASGLVTANSVAEIRFNIPTGPVPTLLAGVIHADGDTVSDFTESYMERSGTSAKIIIDPRNAGYRLVQLYYHDGADWIVLGRFIVIKRAEKPQSEPYPIHYYDYFTVAAVLAAPLRDTLHGGSTVSFDLTVPGATKFYVGSQPLGFSVYPAVNDALRQAVTLPSGSGLCYVCTYVGGTLYTVLGYSLH